MSEDNRRICASIYSRQTERVKQILTSIQEADLTADELGNISIVTGLYRMIKIDDEENKGKMLKFPTVANLE